MQKNLDKLETVSWNIHASEVMLRDNFNLRVKANVAGRLLILLYRTAVIIRGLSPPAVK